jgi:hypothetical protein
MTTSSKNSTDIQYRDFHIIPSYLRGWDYYHDDYDGAPDTPFGFSQITGTEDTIQECKKAIDEHYADVTHYRVVNPVSRTITKFFWLDDAITFCEKIKIDLGAIRLYVRGEQKYFDSI